MKGGEEEEGEVTDETRWPQAPPLDIFTKVLRLSLWILMVLVLELNLNLRIK